MDPPKKVEFKIDHENILKKLKLTLGVLFLNSVIVVSVIIAAYFILENEQINQLVTDLKTNKKIYFSEFNLANLLTIIIVSGLQTAILEEFMFRYPVLLLLKNSFRIKLKYDITLFVIILTALFLNYVWAYGTKIDNFRISTAHQEVPWLIFITGIPLYWLIAKTKNLWPAIICHTLSNITLFFFAKLLILLKFI